MRKTIVAVALMALMMTATKGFGKHDGSYLHDLTMNFTTNLTTSCGMAKSCMPHICLV